MFYNSSYMMAKINNDLGEIRSRLLELYGEKHMCQVEFLEVFQLYIANVRLNNERVSGFIFDKSLNQIRTPKVDEIKDIDQRLIGVIDNKEYTMIREIKDGILTYKIEKID